MIITLAVPVDVDVRWDSSRRELQVEPKFYRPRQKRELLYLKVSGAGGRESRQVLAVNGGSGQLSCERRIPVSAVDFDLPEEPETGSVATGQQEGGEA